nr:hypothetical protein [Burkholderia diffusa]
MLKTVLATNTFDATSKSFSVVIVTFLLVVEMGTAILQVIDPEIVTASIVA